MNYRLEKRDGLIYFITENGKAYRLDCVLNVRNRNARVAETRHNHTSRCQWWLQHHRSRDLIDSEEARADYSDEGRWVALMVAWLDDLFVKKPSVLPCITAKRNCIRIARRLMLVDWRRVGKFVAAVWQNGNKGRNKTMADFEISESTYYWRCQTYASILGYGNDSKRRFGTHVDMC